MSGLPGRSRRCKRNRKPAACKVRRTSSSGFVSLPFTARIMRERISDVTLSAMALGGVIRGRVDFSAATISGLFLLHKSLRQERIEAIDAPCLFLCRPHLSFLLLDAVLQVAVLDFLILAPDSFAMLLIVSEVFA